MSPATSWTDLEQGLADELGGLEDRAFVTVSWSAVPTVYVQLEQLSDRLVARTGADDVLLDGRRRDPGARAALERGGWVPPEHDPAGLGTRTLVVAWPTRSPDHVRLAELCVAVFRVLKVLSPADLGTGPGATPRRRSSETASRSARVSMLGRG